MLKIFEEAIEEAKKAFKDLVAAGETHVREQKKKERTPEDITNRYCATCVHYRHDPGTKVSFGRSKCAKYREPIRGNLMNVQAARYDICKGESWE